MPYGWQQFGDEFRFARPTPFKSLAEDRWRGVRGWIQMGDVILTTDCNFVAFKDVMDGTPDSPFSIKPLLIRTVHSCGDAKLFYRQPGTHAFRFSLHSQADGARAGAELDSPLLTYVPEPNAVSNAASLPERLSFFQVEPANVQLTVVERAEDGQGLILRLVETKEGAAATAAEVRAFRPIETSARISIIEDGGAKPERPDGALRISMPPSAIEKKPFG